MKHGSTVKYSKPVNADEAALRFVVVGEAEQGRPLLTGFIADWSHGTAHPSFRRAPARKECAS